MVAHMMQEYAHSATSQIGNGQTARERYGIDKFFTFPLHEAFCTASISIYMFEPRLCAEAAATRKP